MSIDPMTPALLMKLSTLDAVGALEDAMSYTRTALTSSFERPTMEVVCDEREARLVDALTHLNDAHDALTASAEVGS
jgi:hypothetical protein